MRRYDSAMQVGCDHPRRLNDDGDHLSSRINRNDADRERVVDIHAV